MIIFCCSPEQVRWLCSSLWTGDPSSAVGSFSIPPRFEFVGQKKKDRRSVYVSCAQWCLFLYMCDCVCECPSDWLSVTPEEKNRIFPLHRTFFFDIFSSPLISRVRFFGTDRIFWDLKNPFSVTLCCEILGNKWLKTSPISSLLNYLDVWRRGANTHTHTHDPGVNGKQSFGEGVLVGPTCICGGVHPPPFSSDWPPDWPTTAIRGWRNQLLLPSSAWAFWLGWWPPSTLRIHR